MNTVWLRSLLRRYGIPGLLFVAVYLAVYTLWKRGAAPLRAVARQCGALIVAIVIGSQGLLFQLGDRNPYLESDFMAAIRQGQLQVAIKMLEDGADPNDCYEEHSNCSFSRPTALKVAVATDQIPLVKALFRHGAHPTAEDEERAVCTASLLEKDDMLRVLLAHGLHVNSMGGPDSGSALMEVVEQKNAQRAAERLLDAGADVNSTDADGRTTLMFAVMTGDPPLVRLLLARGADPNKKDKRGATALLWAKENKNPAIVTLLRQYGARE